MRIAIASGKGGTGKTFLAVHLAAALAKKSDNIALFDCDVEARNDHLFLKPDISAIQDVSQKIPEIDADKCNNCGKCAEICEFHALAVLPSDVLVFNELCHACGGCTLVCPTGAIQEVSRTTGHIEIGKAGNLHFYSGSLNIGEAQAPPVIKAVKNAHSGQGFSIIDSPPGTSCPAVEAVHDVDLVILVAEPTNFGLSDLKLVINLLESINIDYALVINKDGMGDSSLENYCTHHEIPVLLKIPFSEKLNKNYSEGKILFKDFPELLEQMYQLAEKIKEVVQ